MNLTWLKSFCDTQIVSNTETDFNLLQTGSCFVPWCIPCPTIPKIFISDSLWLFCIKINLKIDQITNEILVIEIPFSDIAMCVKVLCVFFLCLVYWSEIVCQHLYVPPIHAGMPIRV